MAYFIYGDTCYFLEDGHPCGCFLYDDGTPDWDSTFRFYWEDYYEEEAEYYGHLFNSLINLISIASNNEKLTITN
tara:strand:+ start:1041 stop:1265 length:225 start_codon:yes stop_codon:yes gene_type:complete